MKNKIIQGDCIEEMKKLEENSVDAIVTDPPYGIGFMGKEWDNFKNSHISKLTKGYKESSKVIPSIRNPQGEKSKGINSPATKAGLYDTSIRGARGYQKWCEEWSKEALRILKPGAFMLVSCSTRMYHRMVCGIEDSGFEIRDTISWIYASGFPKSLNIGKQVDKIQGNERKNVGEGKGKSYVHQNKINVEQGFRPSDYYKDNEGQFEITKGNSEWEGWGTAIKPACEPIVVARKPLSEKNVALNVLKWGTGGINIDECRIELNEGEVKKGGFGDAPSGYQKGEFGLEHEDYKVKWKENTQGRFPANIILDEHAGKMLDEQSGKLSSGVMEGNQGGFGNSNLVFGDNSKIPKAISYGDKGGASRFFYCPKASKAERNLGCEDLEKVGRKTPMAGRGQGGLKCKICNKWKNSGSPCICENPDFEEIKFNTKLDRNNHPTVKPIKLMEYLIKLVSRKNATILDPFLGSGTTAIACLKLNRKFIGIEKEEEYVKIANARIKPFLEQRRLE